MSGLLDLVLRNVEEEASPKAGSYAETRLKELKEQRKKYNVDDFGYYRGGLPQKKKGPVRGNSLGRPGYFH